MYSLRLGRIEPYSWRSDVLLRWAALLLAWAGVVLVSPAALGQEASGALAGKLTDVRSAPLVGVTLVLRNDATGAEMRTITGKDGAYRFTGLDAGEYSLEAESAQLGRGQLDDIEIFAGREARVQAAMSLEPMPSSAVMAAAPVTPSRIVLKPESRIQIGLEKVAPDVPVRAEPLRLAPLAAKASPALVAVHPQLNLQIAMEPVAPDLRLAAEPLQQETLRPRSAPEAAQRTLPGAKSASIQTTSVPLETVSAIAAETLAILPSRSGVVLGSLVAAAPVAAPAFNLVAQAMVARGFVAAMAMLPSPYSHLEAASEAAGPASPAVTTTIDSAQLQALPVSGRHWQDFVLDTPGASAGGGSAQVALRGAGQDPADTAIDGASTRLAFGGAAGAEPRSEDSGVTGPNNTGQNETSQGYGGRGLAISEVAIRNVEIVAGDVEAKGGHAAGGGADVETRGGSNQFHGQGFVFDRQNTWGARNPFTQWLQNTGTEATPGSTPILPSEPVFSSIPFTPPDHETVWGLGMGGRIRRDKLYWFGALDSYHRNDPGLATAKEPIGLDEQNNPPTCLGFFCPPSDAQVQLLSAQLGESESQAAADYFGMPGSSYPLAGLEQLASLLAPAPRTAAQWTGFGRIDWQATERQHFTLEGIGSDWNSPGGGLTRVSENYGSHSFGSSHASEEWLLGRWEAFLTPNLLAVTQASAGRDLLTARPDTPSDFEQSFLHGNAYGQLPQMVVDSRYGFTIGNPSRFGQGSYPDERLYHAQEMVDWVRNKLLVKAGFEIDHNSDATSLLRNQTGTYHYAKVQNFISDALAFLRFGLADALDPANPHNCDATGGPWYASTGQLMGLGALPCYSSYSQMMGPTNWYLSTNDWAGYVTTQWQPSKIAVFSAGLRWELEQLPPPIAALDNPELPFTDKLPNLGNNWGPRVSLAIGDPQKRWPVLRLGYGMYYGRVENATIETALTQTGSLKGDLSFFMRPQDDCQSCSGGAPPFPYVFVGEPSSVVKPGAVGFAPNFRNPEVHQAVAAVEQPLPGHVEVTASAMVSLGRRLPVSIDTNVNTSMSNTVNAGITYNVCDEVPYTAPGANGNGQSSNTSGQCGFIGQGPIKTAQITIPYFYASWPGSAGTGICPYYTPTSGDILFGRLCPDYQAITQITSKANSTYEAAMVKLVRYGHRGLSFHAHYTYAHAMDWNPDGVTLAPESDVVDPNSADFSEEYGTSNLDVRHSAAVMAIFEAPWKLHGEVGRFANGWMLSGIGEFHSGLPYSMRITGSIPTEYGASNETITGLGSSMNGYGGDDRFSGLPRNTFRYPNTWKADLRLAKRFDLGEMRQLEVLAESFNLFNHENVTEIETTGYFIENGSPPSTSGGSSTPPSLNFLTGLYVNPKTGIASPAFGQPLNINGTNFYRERQIQFGLRMRF